MVIGRETNRPPQPDSNMFTLAIGSTHTALILQDETFKTWEKADNARIELSKATDQPISILEMTDQGWQI
jgi:hypothetical protein